MLDTAALVVWDVGTRSPLRLIADMRGGLRSRTALIRGAIRFLTGAVALVLAVALLRPLAIRTLDATILETGALVTALVLEALIGPALRDRRRSPSG